MKKIATSILVVLLFAEAWGVMVEKPVGKMKVEAKIPLEAQEFSLTDVRLLDGVFKSAMERDGIYLLSLEPDRFLAWFRKEAGLNEKGRVYGGWESQGVAGHCLGHYLSACSMMYAAGGDNRFRERVDYIVDELAVCQKANGNGYVGAIPEGKRMFAEIARGQLSSKGFDLNGGWVPWYTMHKVMAGLRDGYLYCGNKKALYVLVKLCDWADATTGKLTDEQWQQMLACEHGGMNEVLADVYAITGNEKYLALAKKFYHKSVLDPLAARDDRLAGLHANTQVPKLIGAARIYELTGEENFGAMSRFFWQRVVGHHSYVNGGNSADEHFGQPDKLSDRMHDTTETCNSYNMLKLTEHLFCRQASAEYGDYYERTLLNHILAHQHPATGMMMYKGFLDMPAKKDFCTPFDSFWCCVGTGMENHAKYGHGIYYHKGDVLYVNLFIASEMNWKDMGLTVRQETKFPYGDTVKIKIDAKDAVKAVIAVRRPYWTEGMTVKVNGQVQDVRVNGRGFVELGRIWQDGDVVDLQMPMRLRIESMHDNANRIAFLYGPTVLCADLGRDKEVPVLVGSREELLKAFVPVQGKGLEFAAGGTGKVRGAQGWEQTDIRLLPLFEAAEQRYTVYMDVFSAEGWLEKQREYEQELARRLAIEARTVDVLLIGQMQPERDHNLQGENTGTGEHLGRKWRHAVDGGWFAFDMKVLPDAPVELLCTYWGSDSDGRVFDVFVDDVKAATQTLNNDKPRDFFDVVYALPEELTKGKEKVRVKLSAHPGNTAGGLFGCSMLKKQ